MSNLRHLTVSKYFEYLSVYKILFLFQLLSKSHIDLLNKLRNKDSAHSKALEALQLWDANKDPTSEKALLWLVFS